MAKSGRSASRARGRIPIGSSTTRVRALQSLNWGCTPLVHLRTDGGDQRVQVCSTCSSSQTWNMSHSKGNLILKLDLAGSCGAVQSMDNFDITGDGVLDLIVGRHDGNIEVYAYDEGEEAEPVLKYQFVRTSFLKHE